MLDPNSATQNAMTIANMSPSTPNDADESRAQVGPEVPKQDFNYSPNVTGARTGLPTYRRAASNQDQPGITLPRIMRSFYSSDTTRAQNGKFALNI